MNFTTAVPGDILRLDRLRDTLIRLEDTIIFDLIERAQFAHNNAVYQPGLYKYEGREDFKGSFLEYFLSEVERVHAKVRRYQSPDEYPFTSPLPEPVIPTLEYPKVLVPNDINVNAKIIRFYLDHIVPAICAPGDDQNYGSAATRDVECLQALSQRIHYGKFVAEAKFRDPVLQPRYVDCIRRRDVDGLLALLTNRTVEEALLRRLRLKALTYGRDITEDGSATNVDGHSTTEQLKISVDVVVDLYGRWVIPLTKEVEVEYLLVRLDNDDTWRTKGA